LFFIGKAIAPALLLTFAAWAGVPLLSAASQVVEGNPGSPVKVLIYEDLQCSECAQLRILLDEKILPRYGKRVTFVHRDFPLGKHDWARDAAIAGRWVYEKDPEAGITFRREIMAEQNNITAQNLKAWLTEFAQRNQLDSKGILNALKDERMVSLVDQDRQSALARGVAQIPSVYIGGVSLTETIIYEDLARALDQALAK
jgi:protein-disulfide isomerase